MGCEEWMRGTEVANPDSRDTRIQIVVQAFERGEEGAELLSVREGGQQAAAAADAE